MWLPDGFSVAFFGRWRGQCAYTLIPVWLPYTVINVQGGGGGNEHRKTPKVWKTSNLIKVVGSISNHIGSCEW